MKATNLVGRVGGGSLGLGGTFGLLGRHFGEWGGLDCLDWFTLVTGVKIEVIGDGMVGGRIDVVYGRWGGRDG